MAGRNQTWRNRIVGYADVEPSQLLANPNNYRRHPKEQQNALSGVIDEIGYFDPVLVQAGTDLVIDGHLRVELAMRSGQPTIPVKYADLTDEEAALALATFDPLTAMAFHDAEQLNELLAMVETNNADVQALLDSLATGVETIAEGLTDPDDVVGAGSDEDATTKAGDIWLLGKHRLMCGDSTVVTDVERLMNGERARLMATDPPYLVDYDGGRHPQSWSNSPAVKDKHWDEYREGDAEQFYTDFIATAIAVALVKNPAIYQWHAATRSHFVINAWKKNGLLLHQQIIWVKARAVLTHSHYMWQHEPCFYGWVEGNLPAHRPEANWTTVWQIDQAGESDGIHPTQKPVETVAKSIQANTAVGDLIYEPFSGSGTAIIAAEQTGRRCYAMELSPAFVDAAVARWERFTGQTATLDVGTSDALVGTSAEAAD